MYQPWSDFGIYILRNSQFESRMFINSLRVWKVCEQQIWYHSNLTNSYQPWSNIRYDDTHICEWVSLGYRCYCDTDYHCTVWTVQRHNQPTCYSRLWNVAQVCLWTQVHRMLIKSNQKHRYQKQPERLVSIIVHLHACCFNLTAVCYKYTWCVRTFTRDQLSCRYALCWDRCCWIELLFRRRRTEKGQNRTRPSHILQCAIPGEPCLESFLGWVLIVVRSFSVVPMC